jgi:hypothetical protein
VGSDLAQEPQRPRLEATLLALTGQTEGTLGLRPRCLQTTRKPIAVAQGREPNRTVAATTA